MGSRVSPGGGGGVVWILTAQFILPSCFSMVFMESGRQIIQHKGI